ncbi:MAG: GYD domain-containing protein [Candidatus Omnitrophica bacterium]|nr:GYD domain-containing protein [Candidatus Omnitrophota bacterium]
MAKFVMLGKYSADALNGISAERTKKGIELIEKSGGKVISMLALLGRYDILLVADFPGINEAMKTSIALTKLTGIGFNTCAAISVEELDKLA